MRSLMSVLAALAVMALAFWAYRENYATKASLDGLATLEREIAEERGALAILRAEWAYLNRPDRLRDLADLNFERLRLLPFLPDQFGRVEEVAYPRPEIAMDLDGAVDAFGALDGAPASEDAAP